MVLVGDSVYDSIENLNNTKSKLKILTCQVHSLLLIVIV